MGYLWEPRARTAAACQLVARILADRAVDLCTRFIHRLGGISTNPELLINQSLH